MRAFPCQTDLLVRVLCLAALTGLPGCGPTKVKVSGKATVTAAATPTLSAHNLAFFFVGGGGAGITTKPIDTQPSGSTLLAFVGRGRASDFTEGNPKWDGVPATNVPTDSIPGNGPAAPLGVTHNDLPFWPGSGEALFAWPSVVGGKAHTFTAKMLKPDEITLAVVEIKNGGNIENVQWNQTTVTGPSITSLDVTTTGPATLVSFWFGSAGGPSVTATPNNGFTVIDSQLLSDVSVEAAVATKNVSAAGTYNITWNQTPNQGAHVWLVAVQNASAP